MKNTVIPINIWDDFYDDGFVPNGEIQMTDAYVEEYQEFSSDTKKKAMESMMDFLKTLNLPGVDYSLSYYNNREGLPEETEVELFEQWSIVFKHLTHARLETLMQELTQANLSVDGIPLYFYSES